MKYFFTKSSFLLFALVLMTSAVMAQFTVTGTISDSEGEPLIGATVLVKGTALGTVTDFDGNYSINVPGDAGELEFSYTGYSSMTMDVSSTNSQVDVILDSSSTQLDEVVVTGLASSVKRSNSANSVASIGAKELTGVTTQATMDGALYGKFKGADIRSNSGAPGGGMSIKLRGVTSIFGSQQPLYIVDGVFVDNSTVSQGTNIVSSAAGGGSTATNQDDASNRIADIDPEDIESIEILKGASAAAIYGSRAAGGVVLISTKKGKAGRTKIGISQSIGLTSAISLLGDRGWDVEKVREVFGDDEAARAQTNGFNDYEKELYGGNGVLSTSRFTLSGGTEKTQFFVGATYKDDEGLVANTGYEKVSIRANIDHKLADWLDLSITNNYINSSSDRGFFNNSNSNTTVGYALAFTRPWENLFADENGNYPAAQTVQSNVLETVNTITNNEKVNRYIGGGTATWKIMTTENQSLKLVARAGLDQYALRNTGLFPQTLQFYRSPSSLRGVSISGTTVNTNVNLSAFLVHSYFTESGLNFRTQVGVTQEDFDQNTVITTASTLNGSQTNIDQAANIGAFQNRVIQQDKGFFVQEEVN
ncbi:MAG: carboxypeptidase-like regulatory domain-containing protein, partial [Saprospiraceae bacterium]